MNETVSFDRLDYRSQINVRIFLQNICSAAIFFDESSSKIKYFECFEDASPGNVKTIARESSPLIGCLKKLDKLTKTSIFTREVSV